MTSTFTGMEFNGYVSSPSASPNNTIFSNGIYFENTSDSSTPNSPVRFHNMSRGSSTTNTDTEKHINQMSFNGSIPYDMMYNYGATPASYYPTHGSKSMSIDYTSSNMDEKDRRRKKSESSKSSDKDSMTNMHLRRRAQNRASQRAFRERKEKHVKGLEHQLEELHEKHQDLIQSYSKQAEEVSRLNSRISELATELNTVRHCPDVTYNDMMMPDKFDKFDAFSTSDFIYNPGDTYYDKGPVDMTADFGIHDFEESL